MKHTIKKTICLLAAVASMTTFAACGSEENVTPEVPQQDDFTAQVTYTDDDTSYTEPTRYEEPVTEYITEPSAMPTEPAFVPYEQRVGFGDKSYFESKYLKPLWEFDMSKVITPSEEDVDEEAAVRETFADYDIEAIILPNVIRDTTGQYYGYHSKTDSICKIPDDIIGDIVYYGDNSTVSVDNDGYIYYNDFASDGTRYPLNDVNKPLTATTADGIEFDHFDSIEFDKKTREASYFLTLCYTAVSDGKHLYGCFDEGFNSCGVLSEAPDRIIAECKLADCSALFTRKGDKTSLYVSRNTQDNTVEFAVPLPDGYTVDDIQYALYNDTIMVIFNDNTVYCTDNTFTTLTLHEVLTKHYQNDKLLKITADNDSFTAFMANGVMYDVSPEGTFCY